MGPQTVASRQGAILFFALCVGCLISGCASSSSETDNDPLVHPAAYAADNFTYDKTQPPRQKNDFQFYYKHCDSMSSNSYYSKTAYDCTGVVP